MKVQELLEASKASSVQIKNKVGVFKKFKSMNSPGAAEWARSWDDPEKDKTDAKARKQREKERIAASKASDEDILEYADYALTAALDGGDPMDAMEDLMKNKVVDMDKIDKVVNKAHKVKGGLYGYIARSWADTQHDRVADAKHSKNPESDGQFYDVKDGKIIPRKNPWV